MSIRNLMVAGCVAAGAFSGSSSAQATLQQFLVHDHPDGGERPPKYALRLDGIISGNGNDIYTFSADDSRVLDNPLMLTYDDVANTIQIKGKVYGGKDAGNSGDYVSGTHSLWEIDVTYAGGPLGSGVVSESINDPSFEVVVAREDTLFHTGTMTGLGDNTGTVVDLQDEDGNMGFSFKFNNVDNHRLGGHGLSGPDTFVGWGWLNHDGGNGLLSPDNDGRYPHLYSSDWLFTAERQPDFGITIEAMPEPVTSVFGMMGLGALGMATRRRRGARSSS